MTEPLEYIPSLRLEDVRVGNYMKESGFSSRGRSLEPFYRVELRDLSYVNFMVPIEIDKEWCRKLKMDVLELKNGNYWMAEKEGLRVKYVENGKVEVVHITIGGSQTGLSQIKHIHQLQNFFYFYYGYEIDEQIDKRNNKTRKRN
jgi:hypothetical protein